MAMKTTLTTTMEENVMNQGILSTVLPSVYNNGGLWGNLSYHTEKREAPVSILSTSSTK